jgi:ATP-dependent exoDNAse (exonuclease V) alpha subunit
MAIYHFTVKCLSRRKNQNAVVASAYRAGERLEVDNLCKIVDYRKKRQPLHKEILAPDNSPQWVYDRQSLWNAVEAAESREDAQVAREVEISLPAELALEQQIELVRAFVREQFVGRGMIADVAINRPPHARKGDPRNIFAQILLTTRLITNEGFARLKERSWNTKWILKQWRIAWEEHANQALFNAGRQERIRHQSLKARGLQKEAIDDELADIPSFDEASTGRQERIDRRSRKARGVQKDAIDDEVADTRFVDEVKKQKVQESWKKDYLLISVPKKYQFLVKAYSSWLKSQPEELLEEFEKLFQDIYKNRPSNQNQYYNKSLYKNWIKKVNVLQQNFLEKLERDR